MARERARRTRIRHGVMGVRAATRLFGSHSPRKDPPPREWRGSTASVQPATFFSPLLHSRASLSPRMKFPWISLERSYRSSIYSKPCFCSSPLRTRLPRSNLSSVFREESINFFLTLFFCFLFPIFQESWMDLSKDLKE